MSERPRDRTTVLVGWATVVVMAIIAAIFLLISSPWNDPHPGGGTHKPKQPSSQQR